MAEFSFWQAVLALNPTADFVEQHRQSRRIAKRAHEAPDLRPIRIALLASSTVDHFIGVLNAYLMRDGFKAEFYVAEFNTMYQAALDPNSELYAFKPDIIWIFTNHRDLNFSLDTVTNPEQEIAECEEAISRFGTLWEGLREYSSARVILNNADRPEERILGNYDLRHSGSYTRRIARFNDKLVSAAPQEITIFDLSYLCANVGLARWHDRQYWYHSKHAFSPDSTGQVAHAAARLIRGLMGQAHKCLVLDLDNTIWGGVIGDDGVGGIILGQGDADGEAFLDFQRYAKALKARGVILAVCSKNEEENAKEAFERHPEMVLSLEDIAVFVCNWTNKAENISSIANTLDIGLDSIVFVDDNPAERSLVRELLPMVAVPEMPEDPALYCAALDRENYFELASFSTEDQNRGKMYRDNAHRKALQVKITDVETYLANLEMRCVTGKVGELTLPRATQLINKSNQFHLTTTRYSEKYLYDLLERPEYDCLYFQLEDRFGDNGLISVVILEEQDNAILVDTWVMSCRVLSRGVEDFIHNEIMAVARRRGVATAKGTYLRTQKNNLVADLFDRLGWTQIHEDDDRKNWEINPSSAKNRPNHIKRISNE